MKQIRFFIVAAACILFAAACSNNAERHIIKINILTSDSMVVEDLSTGEIILDTTYFTLSTVRSYEWKDGNVIRVCNDVAEDPDASGYVDYFYQDGQLIASDFYQGGELISKETFTYKDGKIIHCDETLDGETMDMEYDADGHLMCMNGHYCERNFFPKSKDDYEFDDNNMTKITQTSYDKDDNAIVCSYEYTYDNKINPLKDLLFFFWEHDPQFWSKNNVVGVRYNFPAFIGEETISYTYDGDYPVTAVAVSRTISEDNGQRSTRIVTSNSVYEYDK